jgi:hypothetical protein
MARRYVDWAFSSGMDIRRASPGELLTTFNYSVDRWDALCRGRAKLKCELISRITCTPDAAYTPAVKTVGSSP